MNDPLLIFFVAFLAAIILVLSFVIIMIFISLSRSTKLKARQYLRYSDYVVKNSIVFLGDSLTEFFPIEEFFHSFNPYNRGIASDNTAGVLERLETNVINIEPQKVFLQIGTNDLVGAKRRKKEDIIKNIQEILRRLREGLPKCELYFISLYPVNKKAHFLSIFFVNRRKNKDIMAINHEINTYCEKNNITYIDVYNHLTDDDGNLKKEYTVEGLHINYEGYRLISRLLLPYLES